MKLIKYFLIIILINTFNHATSKEIKTIATINNQIITNVDLIIEINTLEYLNNKKINKQLMPSILQQMISEKIKELEINEYKMKINETIIENKYKKIVSNKNKEITNSIKENIKKKIKYNELWSNLIQIKYRNKLEVNLSEIEQIIKNQKLDNKDLNKIINLEKNKKLNTFSKTFFNEIKIKYLVKTF